VISAIEAAQGLYVEITCRQPKFFSADGPLVMRLNGERIAELPLTPEWCSHRVSLPSYLIKAAMNRLEIRWPFGSWQSEAGVEESAAELEMGRFSEMCPSFGDIWSLWLHRDT
jgi:hypothetical protein